MLDIVPCVILAGGRSRRMGGGDKCLLPLGGRPLLAHVVERLRGQVGALALNANGDPARFAAFGLPVVADVVPGFAGPLAGIHAGLNWAEHHAGGSPAILTVAADTPFFPSDLVARLWSASRRGTMISIARSGGRPHPVFGVFPVAYREELESFIRVSKALKVTDWLDRHEMCFVDFDDRAPGDLDPFFNVNTPDDLAVAEGANRRTGEQSRRKSAHHPPRE